MAPCTALCLRRSNVIAINTPATQSFGGSITMEYDYNRLINKRMPNSTGTDLYDVDYTYGSYNDGRNGAGRIVSITQGGSFKSDYFRYDELGQRVEEEVSIDVPMHGVRNFTTQKFFDSFGRILQAQYPDGDQVDYGYNGLGELNTIKSKVAGVTQDIVSAISYNGYGQISQIVFPPKILNKQKDNFRFFEVPPLSVTLLTGESGRYKSFPKSTAECIALDREGCSPNARGCCCVAVRGVALLRAFQCAQVGVGQSAQTVEADGYPLGGGESAHVERGG